MSQRSIPIKVRLTAWYFVIMAIAMSALAVLALAGMKHSIHSTVDEQLVDRVNLVKKLVLASSPRQSQTILIDQLRENLGPDREQEVVQISDESGISIFRSTWLQNRVLLSASGAAKVEKKRHPFFDAEVNGEPFRGVSASVAVGAHTYSIQVAQDMDDFNEATSRFLHLLLAVIPVLLLAASFGGYWISNQALAPVDQITKAAQEINGRNLSARLTVPNSGDEVARLAETLNAMLERIDLALKQIAQFTADASHELRTPIALMRTRAELALRRPRSAAENRETIEQLHADVVRTSELVERLMLLARADSGASLLRFETIDLGQLVRGVLAQTSVLAEYKQLVMEADLASTPVLVQGDVQFLRQLLVILIDNAVKYTAAPGKVTVALSTSNGTACLSVSDTGMGIQSDDLAHIFERFYRGDKVRSRETGGVGLGLAIGLWIAESHRGTLTAASTPGAGSTFSVKLPLQNPSKHEDDVIRHSNAGSAPR